MTLFFEIFTRFSMIGALLALSALIIRHGLQNRMLQHFLLLNISIICLLFTAGSKPFVLDGLYAEPLIFLSDLIYIFAWRFGMMLFSEDFRLGRLGWLLIAIYVAIPLFARLHFIGVVNINSEYLSIMRNIYLTLSFVVLAHLIYRAIAELEHDLVEVRRRDRIRFAVFLAALLITTLVGAEISQLLTGDTRYLFILAYPVVISMNLWLTRVHPEVLIFQPTKTAKLDPTRLDPRDEPAYSRLIMLMEQQRIYAQQGLSIRTLAEKVGIPEHQLRVLINQSLGYRNFSAFLNHYRINEAIKTLSDIEQSKIPVLTIAMDVGYSSITPFNTAFKSITGTTPTSFRKRVFENMH